ncbi:hypothetical protein B0A52_06183 [Exophiala mesophila]|uniref:Very long-chain fatty acid transport protein n=1 Tax=Exophiala mesophila TaxID=212818 RepID=A0A438N2Q3_EXOME|nr:hypothetical protein B0A52_06183 [Exophiala mesophila]
MVVSSLAAPAAAAVAGFAYLNARWRIPVDLHLIKCKRAAERVIEPRDKVQQINSFYLLEQYANDPRIQDQLFIIYEGQTWTFRQSYEVTLRYAAYLDQQHTIQKGDIVAIDFINSPQFIFLTFAIWSLGASPALINYNLVGEAFLHSVRVSTARVVIVDPEVAPHVLTEEAKSTLHAADFRGGDDIRPLQTVVWSPELQNRLESTNSPMFRAPNEQRSGATPRSLSVLIFTSGTTGMPKAAVVTWARKIQSSVLTANWISLQSVTTKRPDRYYVPMPLYHGMAFLGGFSLCLETATTLVLSRRFSVAKFWDEVAISNATVFCYVGETLRYLFNQPPRLDDSTRHRVRLAIGIGLRTELWDLFKERFGIETIAEFYSATESVNSSANLNRNSFTSGAVGDFGLLLQLAAKRTQAIVELDWETEEPRKDPHTGFCTRVAQGEPGELLYAVDPKNVSATYAGYFRNTAATNAKIWRNVFRQGDAWFRTGDVLRLDKDGRLWFSDRIGDTFRWRSENVSTNEVSEALCTHEAILEANVYGVEVPRHEGRAGCAALLLRDVSSPETPIAEETLKSIATLARHKLPKYAVPVFLRIVTEAMATGNNKQQKHILRKEGVDPATISATDRVFYLPPGSEKFEPFGSKEWDSVQEGHIKL